MARNKSEKNKAQDPAFGYLPMQVDIGWISQVEARRDAVDKAKGHIDSRFSAKEASWYRVLPFMGGYLWEAHEGGPGKSYLDAIADELKRNPNGEYWIPSGEKRVVRIAMRDGKPAALMPNEAESLKIRNSGQAPLIARGSMKPFARKGTEMLVFGGVLAGSGFLYMIVAAGFFLSVWQPDPMVRPVRLADLPHSQWGKVENTNPETIVSKLELASGRWNVVTREHVIPALAQERKKGQDINNAFDNTHFDFEDKKVIDTLSPGQSAISPATQPASPPPTSPAARPGSYPAPVIPPPVMSPPTASVPGTTVAPPPSVPTTPSVKVTPPSPQASPSKDASSAEEDRAKRVLEQLQRIKAAKAAQEKALNEVQPAVTDGAKK